MITRFRLFAAATATALALSTQCLRAEEPVQGGYSDELKTLRARLDQLEAQQKEADRLRQEAERKLDEKVTSDQLSQDAVHRDQFISAEGFTAGYSDNRFSIQSADGNFVLRPWFHVQVREVTLDRQGFQGNKKEGPEDEWDSGFEVRRMRFGVDGNMFSPDLTYLFNWATYPFSSSSVVKNAGTTVGTVSNNQGGVPILEEAWVKYHIPTTPYFVQVGQLRDPVLHDQLVSSQYQQSAERSLTADIFTNAEAFTEGAMFIYDPGAEIRAEGGVNHGMRSANTNFFSYPDNGNLNQFNYGFAGRVEYKVMGRWRDYSQIGSIGTREPLLVFGSGADYSERGHSGQVVAATDVMYADPTGINFYGAFVDRYTSHNFGIYTQSPTGANIGTPAAAVANTATNEYSILLEAGYLFDNRWEPFGRYEYMRLQGTPAGSRNNINVITGGVNYFFHGNRLKLTGEVIWLPQGLPISDTNSDLLINSNGKTELSFVAQIQLLL